MTMSVKEAQEMAAAANAQVKAAQAALSEARKAEAAARREREAQERRDFDDRMFREYGEPFGLPREVFDRAMRLAWEYGRASGYDGVEQNLGDLADLAVESFNAGRAVTSVPS